MTDHRFTTKDVLDLVAACDGEFDDGLEACISAGYDPAADAVEVELTSTEEDESQRVTERFRVTVERITDTTKEN